MRAYENEKKEKQVKTKQYNKGKVCKCMNSTGNEARVFIFNTILSIHVLRQLPFTFRLN